jgi:hypothetical protein
MRTWSVETGAARPSADSTSLTAARTGPAMGSARVVGARPAAISTAFESSTTAAGKSASASSSRGDSAPSAPSAAVAVVAVVATPPIPNPVPVAVAAPPCAPSAAALPPLLATARGGLASAPLFRDCFGAALTWRPRQKTSKERRCAGRKADERQSARTALGAGVAPRAPPPPPPPPADAPESASKKTAVDDPPRGSLAADASVRRCGCTK